MTLVELLAAASTSGLGGAALKSGFDYLRAKGGLQLTAEQRLWKRIDDLETHVRACDTRNDELVGHVAQLQMQNADQARQIAALRTTCERQEHEITGLRRDKNALVAAAKQLEREMAEMRREGGR